METEGHGGEEIAVIMDRGRSGLAVAINRLSNERDACSRTAVLFAAARLL